MVIFKYVRLLFAVVYYNIYFIIKSSNYYFRSTFEEYVDFPLMQASRLFDVKGFDKNRPTVLYMHGFIETAQKESVQVPLIFYNNTM